MSPARKIAALGGLLAAALLACAPAPRGPVATAPAPDTGVPALWRAEAPGGGVHYLLGSVHLGSREPALGERVQAAWQRADELVVEVDLSQIEPEELVALAQRYGMLVPPETLDELLSAPTRAQLTRYFERRGLPREAVSRFKPWFLATTLVGVELQAAGYDEDLGVDRYFIERAQGKPIVALETASSQLRALDGLPPGVQELMLRDFLARADTLVGDMAEMMAAWQSGDEAALETLVFQPLDELPELEVFYDVVFTRRNQNMASRLGQLASDGKTRLVVLGAGHMLGEQGIPSLLAQRNFRVTRVP